MSKSIFISLMHYRFLFTKNILCPFRKRTKNNQDLKKFDKNCLNDETITTQPLCAGNKQQFYQSTSSTSSSQDDVVFLSDASTSEVKNSKLPHCFNGYESDDSDSSCFDSYQSADTDVSNRGKGPKDSAYPNLVVVSQEVK